MTVRGQRSKRWHAQKIKQGYLARDGDMKQSALGSEKASKYFSKNSGNHKLLFTEPISQSSHHGALNTKSVFIYMQGTLYKAVLILQTIPLNKSFNSLPLTPVTSNCYFCIWYWVQEPFFFHPEAIISSENGKGSRFLFVIFFNFEYCVYQVI